MSMIHYRDEFMTTAALAASSWRRQNAIWQHSRADSDLRDPGLSRTIR